MDTTAQVMVRHNYQAMQMWLQTSTVHRYRVYGRAVGRQLVPVRLRMIVTPAGTPHIVAAAPRGACAFGFHHSHYQPRDMHGRFAPYAAAGRAVVRQAWALNSRVALRNGRVSFVPR